MVAVVVVVAIVVVVVVTAEENGEKLCVPHRQRPLATRWVVGGNRLEQLGAERSGEGSGCVGYVCVSV